MGNRSKDENAAASNNTRDRDQESNSRDQDTRDTSLAKAIAEAVAQQTQTIAEVFQRQIEAVSRQKSEENPGTHRCISKADGGDTGAV